MMRIKEVLISAEEIQAGIDRAAAWINTTYAGKRVVLFGLLKGCVPFFGALMPRITVTCTTTFMTISSFKGGITAQGDPEIITESHDKIRGEDVLIIEDIIDTARSLREVVDWLKERGAKSVKIVTLLDKPAGRLVPLEPDYTCFTIPNLFVVGFGLDYQEEMRNLPFIGILENV